MNRCWENHRKVISIYWTKQTSWILVTNSSFLFYVRNTIVMESLPKRVSSYYPHLPLAIFSNLASCLCPCPAAHGQHFIKIHSWVNSVELSVADSLLLSPPQLALITANSALIPWNFNRYYHENLVLLLWISERYLLFLKIPFILTSM